MNRQTCYMSIYAGLTTTEALQAVRRLSHPQASASAPVSSDGGRPSLSCNASTSQLGGQALASSQVTPARCASNNMHDIVRPAHILQTHSSPQSCIIKFHTNLQIQPCIGSCSQSTLHCVQCRDRRIYHSPELLHCGPSMQQYTILSCPHACSLQAPHDGDDDDVCLLSKFHFGITEHSTAGRADRSILVWVPSEGLLCHANAALQRCNAVVIMLPQTH